MEHSLRKTTALFCRNYLTGTVPEREPWSEESTGLGVEITLFKLQFYHLTWVNFLTPWSLSFLLDISGLKIPALPTLRQDCCDGPRGKSICKLWSIVRNMMYYSYYYSYCY